ncbi:MAG: putative MFS-type transporter YhjX [Anaerolineales bacterium]|nr:putative MFS-type transporter YhjX [Anaerolineales bacterium]
MIKTEIQNTCAIQKSRLVNQSPVFYGWIVMLAGTLGLIMTSPGQTYSVSIFIEHFIQDLGISRSLVSTLYTVGTLVGSFAMPIVGRQIDRRGSRLMVVVISVLFGFACVYMGFVSNAIMLGLGFVAIRLFGQGSLGLVSQNVINQWWVRRRGTVMGLSGVLMALLGIGGFPNLINWLIPIHGWRSTYMLLGLALLFVMVPMGLILFRNHPEDYGLEPDGDSAPAADDGETAGKLLEENWSLSEAIRTPVFWILTLSIASIAMLATGLFFHMVSIFKDNGLPATVAASVFVPIALATALANLGSGILVDRVPLRVILVTALILQTLSLGMAQFMQSIELALVYGVVLGTTMGLIRTVSSVGWATYFGRRHLGSITGTASTISIAGSALGPMPLGIARDLLGSYNLALTISAVLPLLLAVASLFVGKPERSA